MIGDCSNSMLLSLVLVFPATLTILLVSLPLTDCFLSSSNYFHRKTALASSIAERDGGIDWLNNQPSIDGEDMGFQAFLDSVDVMIMGRNTFEKVVSFGPDAWAYGDMPVVVLSRGTVQIPKHLQKTVSSSSLEPKDLVAKLEGEGYEHAYVDGGYTIRQFMKQGLIHHLTLTTVPVILGDGISLFSDQGRSDLELIESKAWSNGMIQNKYKVLR